MDSMVLKDVQQKHHPYSWVKKEDSIYGKFDVDYTVKPHGNGDIEVHKLHDMRQPHHIYQNLVSNNEPGHCDMGFENPIMHDSRKDYLIVKQDDHHVVKEIRSVGALVYYPFKAESDHQFILVNQTFHLHEMVPIQEQFHVQSEHVEDHLTYHSFEDREDGSVHDITNGRHVVDYDKRIPKVQQMLVEIFKYLHENHIHTEEPDSKREQLVNRVQRLLQHFSLAKIEELHKRLTGEATQIFYHILPLVGSKASTLYIKHLIVNKTVKDEQAVEMLQHFPEHVVEPTVDLLAQLEELIHLDENVPWHVRKAALLSFANLIHKSHTWTEKVHRFKELDHHVHHADHDGEYSHQQPYEKYVVEYLNKLRSSQDYKVQMTCAFALANMKLHSIIKHMLPAINGEWYNNQHFRLLTLWPVASAVLHDRDPDTIIETLWPIFTDVDENTEMRTLAFYYIMESHPTDSRLMNMLSYLLHESNEEVYKFVYTYLHTMMETNDPCKQQWRTQMAHLVKLLPPPTHGMSSVHLHDYKDVNFGFSEGVQEYYIHTNHSHIYGLSMTSQHFNIYHEDYSFYLKVHGVHHIHQGEPIHMLVDVFRKKIHKISDNKDIHIEAVIFRHGQVINTWFFDEHNLHELDDVLNFFTKDSHSLTRDLLHMSYNEYHRAVIPTDLGIPAVWEYLMPVVHHNRISMTKEVINKVINVRIDNKHVHWIHYRHGLRFYNPVADVWQGINRYHSYDALWPLRFDLNINTQQQSLQISWKKHNEEHQDIAGLRSHVKQMVFIKDDRHSNVLIQSSPQCKEYVIVSHGKQWRNDYQIWHEDDLTTGHKWHVGVYDSSRYVTNGSFSHLLHQFTQSHSKHTESPFSHFWTTLANWHQYVLLLPKPGTYGFIIRIEPSHQHSISNIDLSLRLHSEPVQDDSHHYTPKIKWSTRATYSVKNREKSLKTWDVNAIIDMNEGHTVNNLKMHVTRIVPGQNDYKICVDGVKKWSEQGVTGHLNVAMSQSPDGKCVKDDTVIDVTMTGQRSQEQVEAHHKYGSCEHVRPYSLPHKHSLQCLTDHTTVRHYVYNVKTTNVPTEFRKTFAHWWDQLKGWYMSYYHYEDEHQDDIAEHNFKVSVDYPMQEEQVNVHVTTPQHVYKLTGVPVHYWRWLGVRPDSVEYPRWFQYLHEAGWVDHCVVDMEHHQLNHHDVHETVPNEWTLYVGNSDQNPETAVYVKRVANDEIAVKVVDHGHTMEIVPHGADHQITLDGQVVPAREYHHAEWVYWHVFVQDYHHPVAVMLHNSGIHLEYHHHQVVVVMPKTDQDLHGRCYSHH